MENQKRFVQEQRSPSEKAADTARRADEKLQETTEGYVGPGDSRRILNFIREQPLMSAGAAFAAGFVVGGGLSGDLGVALIGILARTTFRNTVDDLMGGRRRRRGAVNPTDDIARDI